jgi:hypothetical protein
MTCKLHIPCLYNPITRVTTCECGAVRISDAEAAWKRQ